MVVRTAGIFAVVALMAGSFSPVRAAGNLVLNGDFETTTLSTSAQFGSAYPTNQVANWATSGYNFVFTPGSADTTGATGQYGALKLWGPGTGSNNGLTATSPTGGKFIAADGAFGTEAITQTIGGLDIGGNYLLTFWWGAAQQATYNGATTEWWNVSFGGSNYATQVVNNADHGFVPWRQETVLFRATAVSQVLSFLAGGTPTGLPPFSLLDGVSLVAAPEPASWAMMMVGLLGIGVVAHRLRARRLPDSMAASA